MSARPDPELTPGEWDTEIRLPMEAAAAARPAVWRAYRIPWWRRWRYQIDLLIPPELGGWPTDRNMWPMRRADRERKQREIARIVRAVRLGRMTEDDARALIVQDWGPEPAPPSAAAEPD